MNERSNVTPEQIIATALTIADRDGLDGLTMRKLSAELSVSPPVVYRHFKDKAAIVAGIVERLLTGPALEELGDQPWRAWIERVFTRAYNELRAHPGVLPLLASTETFTQYALSVTESVLGVLRAAGFDGPGAGRAFRLLMSYTLGELMLGQQANPAVQSRLQAEGAQRFFQDYPNVMAAAAQLGRVDEAGFREGLALILDSLGREAGA